MLLSALAACARSPFDSSPSDPPGAADTGPLTAGQIGVTLYSGSLPNGAGFVDLIQPDGSKLSLNAAPSCTFTALTQSGSYRVQFRDQAAAQPAYATVKLSPAAPSAKVQLQVGGASLSVQAVPFQGSSFQFETTQFNYLVQVNQAASAVQDLLLDVDPNGLPPGWCASFGQTVVRGNLSTTLSVSTAMATTATTVTLNVRGRVGSIVQLNECVVLTKAWNLDFSSAGQGCFVTDPDSGSQNRSQIFLVSVSASGISQWANIYVHKVTVAGTLENDGMSIPFNQITSLRVDYNDFYCRPYSIYLQVASYKTAVKSL